jgi:hypothetical protein
VSSNSEVDRPGDLARVVQRAARSDILVAWLLRVWSRASPEASASEELQCSEQRLVDLALCLRPRAEHWDIDIAEIAGACGIEPRRLDAFLKKLVIAERLSLAHDSGTEGEGRLLAARDRHDEP